MIRFVDPSVISVKIYKNNSQALKRRQSTYCEPERGEDIPKNFKRIEDAINPLIKRFDHRITF